MNDDLKAFAAKYKLGEPKQFVVEPQLLTLRYSPDGKHLVAGGYDARVRRWDATQDGLSERPALVGHNGWTQALALSPDGALVFSGDSWGELRAWPLAEDNPQPKWRIAAAHDGWIRDAAVSPDGATLATCGFDKHLRLWSAGDGAKKLELKAENDDLYAVRFSPDGKYVVAGDRMGWLWQWELATQKMVRKLDATILYKLDRIQDVGGVRTLAFDKAGAMLAVGGNKPKNGATIQGIPVLLLFDFATGTLKHTHELGGQNDCDLLDVHLHEAGFCIAVTCGGPGAGKIVLIRPGDKEPFHTENRLGNVQSLAVHPDGKKIAVFGTNNGSNGNGRLLDKDGSYPANKSPLWVLSMAQ